MALDDATAPVVLVLVTVLVIEALQVLLRRVLRRSAAGERRLSELRKELPGLRRQLAGISPQDEFTRWARMQRDLNRKTDELEKLGQQVQEEAQAASARVDKSLYYLSLVCHGALLVMFRRTAIVYLPSAWTVPFGWLLAFPAAPSGSVSITAWLAICRSVVRRALAPLAPPAVASPAKFLGMF